MKTSAIHQFRRKLQGNQPVCGLWVTLEAAAISDIAAGLGMDWIVIDMAHTHLDWSMVLEHVRATARSNAAALVELPEANAALVNRAYEIGVDGVVFPGTVSKSRLREAVQRMKTAQIVIEGPAHTDSVDSDLLVASWIELTQDDAEIAELLSVDGVDFFFCGPRADFQNSTSAIAPGGSTADDLRRRIARSACDAGKPLGAISRNQESLQPYRDEGFRVLGVGIDQEVILGGIHGMLQLAKSLPTRKEASSSLRQKTSHATGREGGFD